jgi:hypothetical protein
LRSRFCSYSVHVRPSTPGARPTDPKIDAVDWVERIPFAETRNYVQRVLENLQVYRGRFGASTAAIEPNLHRAAAIEWRPKPAGAEPHPVPTKVDLSVPN